MELDWWKDWLLQTVGGRVLVPLLMDRCRDRIDASLAFQGMIHNYRAVDIWSLEKHLCLSVRLIETIVMNLMFCQEAEI